MNQTLHRTLFATAACAVAVFSGACSKSESGTENAPAKNVSTIKIAYPNWAEGIAMTYLVADIIRNDFGDKVELTMADPGLVYASLAEGSEDFLLDAWLPVTHESYMQKYGDRLEIVGTTFDKARIGLVVPQYVTIDSIEQLNSNAKKFDGKVIGIGQGAGIMKRTNEALKAYNLSNIELIPSSGPAMTTALGEAIEKHKPIVVTGWAPHWMFARFHLKFLEDPKGVYGADERINTVARKGFTRDHPGIAAFLSRMKMNGATLGGLMDALRDTETEEAKAEAMHKWVENNRTLVNGWLGK